MKESVERKPHRMINRTLTIKKCACDENIFLEMGSYNYGMTI